MKNSCRNYDLGQQEVFGVVSRYVLLYLLIELGIQECVADKNIVELSDRFLHPTKI